MNHEITLLLLEAMIMYFLVLIAHSLRHRFGPVHFYALIGGITAIMSWVTDAGLTVRVGDITFMVGSTVFYTSLLLGVFVVYVFDGPKVTRITISTIVGVSIMMPLIAAALHLQSSLVGGRTMPTVPLPNLRTNTASVVTTLLDLVFLAIAWEFLGKPRLRMQLGFRTWLTLLGVMWLDVLLFATGAFAGTSGYWSIMQGTLVSRLIISLFALPFLYGYLHWQSKIKGRPIENRPVLAILRQVAEIEAELTIAQQEIERRERAEAALRKSEERFRTIVDVLPQFVAYVDKDLTYRFVNRTYQEAFGLEPKDLLNKRLRDVVGEAAFDKSRPHIRKVLSGDQVRYHERCAYALGGTRDIDGVLIPDTGDGEAGEVHGYYAVLTDITPYIEAQETLKQSEERYRRLVEGSPDIMYIYSSRRGAIFWSSRVEEILGYSPEDLAAAPEIWYAAIHPEDFDFVDQAIQGQDADAYAEIQYRMQDRTGKWHWFQDRLISSQRMEGETMTQRLATDVTERREMQEQLRQQERLAAVGQLAGGIAHDFNNLLAAIVLYAQLPLNRYSHLPDDVKNALETILSESNRAANLIQQILDFSRRAMLKTETVDLVPFMQRIVEVLRRTIPENIRLKLNLFPKRCVVEADPTRIQQAVMNLAVNARDAMPNGGELLIELRQVKLESIAHLPVDADNGDWACVRVSDTGTGMTDEVKAHLFEPFFTTKPPGAGTGLGLSQVYGIVTQHRGCVDVTSVVGKGTAFAIYLPVSRDGAENAEAERSKDIVEGHGESLLLVEDAPELRSAIRDYLEAMDYRVFAAANGVDALRLAEGIAPDLLITDIVMPELGGEALLTQIKEMHPGIKAIAITGHVLETDIGSLLEAGFAECVRKPFDVTEFSKVIRRVLRPPAR